MIKKRLDATKALMKQRGHKALITKDPHLLFYLTGIQFSTGVMLLTEQTNHIILDGRYTTKAEPLAPLFHIHPLLATDALAEIIAQAMPHFSGSLAYCPHKTTMTTFSSFEKCGATLPGLQLSQDDELFANIRRVKDQNERALIQKASLITQEVVQEAFKHCKKGVSEKEIAFFLKKGFLERGADCAFEPIVSFGKNSACPHWSPSDERLSSHEVILIDCGAKWENYSSDMTRVLFFKKPPQKLLDAFHAVEKAYEVAKKYAKPGVSGASVYECAFESLREDGFEHLFPHGLGHGVGLEIHEAPSLKKVSTDVFLQEGDVLTIEPGVYIPGVGGIRLENTLLLEKDGLTSFMDMNFA